MNFIKILNAHTDTHWKQVDGPDTRCGIDYYFEDDDGNEAYANVDQVFWSLSVNGELLDAGELQ